MDKAEAPLAPPEAVAAEGLRESDVAAEGADRTPESPATVAEHKRKREKLEAEEPPHEVAEGESVTVETAAVEAEAEPAERENGVAADEHEDQGVTSETADGDTTGDGKRQRLEEETDVADAGHRTTELETQVGNGHAPPVEIFQSPTVDTIQETTTSVSQEVIGPSEGQQHTPEGLTTSRRIEVPNNKVGVLIGKAGETIKFLQFNTGAKIQITRDAEADPHATTRPVELIGTIESISKAEKLIKDVIAEADAGGSPALVARGFGTSQPGAEQLQIQVPNEKVGLIIGKGGETIKNLQTRSRARIQLIPQHLPEGDISKERTVRITGNKEQIEAAIEMIKQVMNQVPVRSSTPGGYTQPMHRHRGPSPAQWGPRAAAPPAQQIPVYDYQQRGPYTTQPSHYPPPAVHGGGYPQQPPPRTGFGPGWDQRSAAPPIQTSQKASYDYYRQGPQPVDVGPGPATASGGAPPAPAGYYGQPQGPGYGQPAAYPQSTPGYDEPRYDSQPPSAQQVYGQPPPLSSQSGLYPHGSAGPPPSGYTQQQAYPKPSSYGGAPPVYGGAPRPSQPGDQMYQGSSAPQYGTAAPPQQQQQQQQPYPYGASTAYQQAPAYGQSYGPPPTGAADSYAQYPQQAGQAAAAPGYAPPAGVYSQGAPPSGYGQYPTTAPGYGEQQPIADNAGYGYPGAPAPAAAPEASYGTNSLSATGYAVQPPPAGGQAAYPPPSSNATGYEQPASVPPQSGGAPASYAKSSSPQTAVYGQYDASQMYAQP